MVRSILGAVLAAGFAQAASAQVLTGEQLAPMLFAPTGAEVEIIEKPYLAADQAAILKQVGAMQPYYGAIAISPDEGIMVEATVAGANHNSTEAAEAFALQACDAKRKGKTPCAVVALIRPAGWAARPYQLSSGATEAFAEYMKIRRDKAFAISASTGLWGMGKGRDAAAKAIAECATKPPQPTDCALLVQD
ncbi:MAG: 5-aminolevulic acid synthase [Cereibacter sphaeroides]|uniref:5-aminolevulic acid synthase n=1 Tax=Cereibacter sphaeroides TaxID=1063 RepID=A0A2W5SHW4_CERSP|nr:MAG: 5-aminolevulic acid synthase [Cereibacter sphaeroides]